MDYQILGTFRIVRDGAVLPVRATKPRRLLATLLLHPNEFVSTDLLADALWDGAPPRSALANLRTYVLSLREWLPGLSTEPSGYRLAVEPGALDTLVMERCATSATALRRAGDTPGALAAYDQALALWRGAPLADLAPCAAWRPALARLDRLRHTVSDGLIEVSVETGDHATAAGVLRERLADDPYDEDRWARLVRSLCAAGRRHEARTAFHDAVRVLADDLDVPPGDDLRAAGALVSPRSRSTTVETLLDRSVEAAERLPYRYFGVPLGTPGRLRAPTSSALAWFSSHAPTLASTVRAAAAQGHHELVWRLAVTWSAYFDLRGPLSGWRTVHEVALASARACGSRRGTAILLRDLGLLAMYRDDWATARRSFTTAGQLFADLSDPHGVAVTTVGAGSWHRERGDLDRALPKFTAALAMFETLGDEAGEAVARSAIGSVWLRRREPAAAESWLTTAYTVATRIGDEHRRAQILERLAELRALRGDHDVAAADLRTAHHLLSAIDDHRCAAKVTGKLLATPA